MQIRKGGGGNSRLLTLALSACFLMAACSTGQTAATTRQLSPEIPTIALDTYARLGTPCPAVDWALLAGVDKAESDNGRIFGGSLRPDGAVTPIVSGPPLDGTGVGGNTTGNLLCSTNLPEGSDPNDIILAYNQSAEYIQNVLTWADRYRNGRLEFAR